MAKTVSVVGMDEPTTVALPSGHQFSCDTCDGSLFEHHS